VLPKELYNAIPNAAVWRLHFKPYKLPVVLGQYSGYVAGLKTEKSVFDFTQDATSTQDSSPFFDSRLFWGAVKLQLVANLYLVLTLRTRGLRLPHSGATM
jgi:hypothetical protein